MSGVIRKSRNHSAKGVEELKRVGLLFQGEVCMQRRGWISPVLARSKNEQVGAWRQGHVRNSPRDFIGAETFLELPTGEISRRFARIKHLDPISALAILVVNALLIAREKLIDPNL